MTNFLIFILVMVIFSSCGKDDTTSGGNTHYPLNENLYPLLFTPGSYWIYNDQGGNTDSVILKDFEAVTYGPNNIGKGYSHTAETYNLSYESTVYGIYTDQYIGYLIYRGPQTVYLSSFKVGDGDGRNARIANIHENMVINGTTYNRVVEMKIKEDYHLKLDISLYYVDSVGIIKKRLIDSMNDSTIWQLINFKTDVKVMASSADMAPKIP